MYCNLKIIGCGLPDVDRQRHIDKFKLLGTGSNRSVFTRFRELTEWTDDSVAPQNGVDNFLLANDVTVIVGGTKAIGWVVTLRLTPCGVFLSLYQMWIRVSTSSGSLSAQMCDDIQVPNDCTILMDDNSVEPSCLLTYRTDGGKY